MCWSVLVKVESALTEAGFGGDGAAKSVFMMGASEVPLVACVAAGACLDTGEVMWEWRLGGLWEPAARLGCECERDRGLVGRRVKDEALSRGDG